MTQITRVPVGLQAFLGTQAQGKNPSELAQVVAPTISLDQFLAIQQEEWVRAGFGTFTTAATETFVVPEGEVWLLRGVGFNHKVSVSGPSGDGYIGCVEINLNPNSSNPLGEHPICRTFPYELQPGGVTLYDGESLPNIVAPAGTQIVFHAQQVSATTTFNSEAALRFLRLEV